MSEDILIYNLVHVIWDTWFCERLLIIYIIYFIYLTLLDQAFQFSGLSGGRYIYIDLYLI